MKDEFGKTAQDVKIDKMWVYVHDLIKFNQRYPMSIQREFEKLQEKYDKSDQDNLRRFRLIHREMRILNNKIECTNLDDIAGDDNYEH